MSHEEEQEILRNILAVASMLKWMGGSVLIVFFTLVVLVVADHYDQANLSRDVQWMRPRVERMWYEAARNKTQPGVPGEPSPGS